MLTKFWLLQLPVDEIQVERVNVFLQTIKEQLANFGIKLVGAILLWIVGQWLINKGVKLLSRLLKRQNIDITLIAYLSNFIIVALKIILIVAILGYFGIETTSFAALLAAAGIAIGAAWGGLLANFAAGVFLILFTPFAVGDFISAAGVTGTVDEIGLFVTTINTPDNVKTIVGNNSIFSDNIQNYSANPYRRVDLVAQLNHNADHQEAIALLKQKLLTIANVIDAPAPTVEILEFNLAGPVLAVRPYCNNDHYWQVYFDTNKLIRETFGEAGYPIPEQHYAVRGFEKVSSHG
ncbi:mechanosensitive ion channel family protein [Cyanobacterium sp. IPPAS B-1200]|uniref:mechanosensitive ion channel family protein n=1 Tax=Cyanobacterium sp. IPPAS B-1200 TaxID=1562720 RepID=UPI0008526A07|nr:mechanosensitive ion channel family protein [Cyanobacterium sp. IPPAS B-1200]OEJ79129.1 mechanosensitive ion channel protein MscS [Cyanobacterium sp. IPPAS B-1200]